jgi:DNA-binding response OmpR family regulator
VRILIVEDEFFAAVLLEEDLRAAGWEPIGPFTTLARAIEAARAEIFDVAILDVNLNGEMVYPLADELAERKRPFIFLSGYGLRDLPERFRSLPKVAKPYNRASLMKEVERAAAQ